MVRIRGRAVARAPVARRRPISRRACIGFCLTVDRHETGSSSWERVIDQEEFDSFVLADGTGQAVLHAPFDMELDPYDARSENVPPAFFEVLEREGVRGQDVRDQHEFRYIETILSRVTRSWRSGAPRSRSIRPGGRRRIANHPSCAT